MATLLSEKGREWYQTVDRILFAKKLPRISGPLSLELLLFPPDRRKIDVDNRNKPVLDSLKRRDKDAQQMAWLFADDDSQVKVLTTIMGPVTAGGKCIVTIKVLPGEVQPELPLADECPPEIDEPKPATKMNYPAGVVRR